MTEQRAMTEEQATVVLSPQQERLVRLGVETRAVVGIFEVPAEASPEELERALAALLVQHDGLRTVNSEAEAGEGEVLPESAFEWNLVDLTGLPSQDSERRLDEFLRAAELPFDEVSGPRIRVFTLRLGEAGYRVILSAPALTSDATGLVNVFEAWGRAWDAVRSGTDFENEGLQYGAVAGWLRGLLEAEDAAVGRDYWRETLAGTVTAPDLALARPDASTGCRLPWKSLASPFVEKLAARFGTEIDTVMTALWGAWLLRVSGSKSVALGWLADGRAYDELADLPGLFARRVPLVLRTASGKRFRDQLDEVVEAVEDVETWQEHFLGLDREGEEVHFTVGFESVRYPEEIPFGPVHARCESLPVAAIDPAGLGLAVSLRPQAWELELVGGEFFDAPALACVKRQLEALLAHGGDLLNLPMEDLELLTATEREQLLTAVEEPVDLGQSSFWWLFAAQAHRTRHRVAVVDGDHRLSFGELERRALALGHRLASRGAGIDRPVGLFLERGAEMVVGILGTLATGGAYVPLDPGSPVSRWQEPLARAGVSLWVQGGSRDRELPADVGDVLSLAEGVAEGEAIAPPQGSAQALAYLVLTSGSTGLPKAVGVRQGSLVRYVGFVLAELGLEAGTEDEAPSFATVSTFAADLGNTSVFPSLACGGTLHVLGAELAMDADPFAAYFERRRVDVLKIVPSHFRALVTAGGAAVVPRRVLVLGGEELRADLVAEIQDVAPDCTVINHYGPTEATVGALRHRLPAGPPPAQGGIPIGRAIPGGRALLLDSRGRAVPEGVVGELYLGGAGVARGYSGQPGLTAERFVPDPGSRQEGARLYRTGDLACRQADGLVRFLGRADHQVKLRGYRVEPGEIEGVLRRAPGVGQCAVIVAAEEGRRWLAAYVAPRDPATMPEVETLRHFVSDHLPEYMVPATWMVLDQLPLTVNGKLDRRALPQHRNREKILPRDSTEQALAEIWCQVLGLREVGVDESFFELGGDSILSIQIVARARQAGLEITPRQIFEHPTVAELAPRVGSAPAVQAEQGEVVGEVTLTPVMHRFFETVARAPSGTRADHYNMSLLLALLRPLSGDLLEHAVRRLLRHHDGLRLRFQGTDPGWEGRMASVAEGASRAASTEVDLSRLPAESRPTARRRATEAVQRSLDLTVGPVFRAVRLTLGDEERDLLLLVVHHLAMDGVSWQILLTDLVGAVQCLEAGEMVDLGPKSTSFKHWAEALETWAQAPEREEDWEPWQGMGRRAMASLPVDYPGGTNREGDAQTVSSELEADLTDRLLHGLTTRHSVRFDEILLAALALALCRFTGGRTVLLELEGHGREEEAVTGVDLSRTIGWFTTHFPLLLELGDAVRPVEILRLVKESLRRLPHRGLPYGALRYLSAEWAGRGHLPEPPVSFNYLGQQDRGLPSSDLLAPTAESSGAERDPDMPRKAELGVHATVTGGRLKSFWTYSAARFRKSTIEELARSFRRGLEDLAKSVEAEDELGALPVDFPELDLDQEELDDILEQLQ